MKIKIFLIDLLLETNRRFPHIDQERFEILYSGWRQQGIRHGRNPQFYVGVWKRGWLAKTDANDFRTYIGLT